MSKTSRAKAADTGAAVSESPISSNSSNRNRNSVMPARNRKKWTKSGATWRNRARSPAPASRGRKKFFIQAREINMPDQREQRKQDDQQRQQWQRAEAAATGEDPK